MVTCVNLYNLSKSTANSFCDQNHRRIICEYTDIYIITNKLVAAYHRHLIIIRMIY